MAKIRLSTHRQSRDALRVQAMLDTIAAAVRGRASLLDPLDMPASKVSERA